MIEATALPAAWQVRFGAGDIVRGSLLMRLRGPRDG
jgi:hypothetical protein